ncbi:hypothetical protein ACN38_g6396 [Penicillium nordicum]|uniref:Uncharacterized protein n=1 Tax=Penicillium nordicum TaxID=229535 RepID=A0A0M8P8R6_9EURO|nr:hypothetical protein ACN38_g6396 [Penicillium nordicum]
MLEEMCLSCQTLDIQLYMDCVAHAPPIITHTPLPIRSLSRSPVTHPTRAAFDLCSTCVTLLPLFQDLISQAPTIPRPGA